MRELDSRDRDRSGLERLQAFHCATPAFDCAMVLLNNIIKVL
jgi:hypothetical protein